MSALGRLVASVVLDASEFVGGTEKARQSAAQLATDVDRQLAGLQKNIGGYMTGIAAAIAAGFGVNAMKEAFDSYSKGAAGLVDLSAKAGTTVEKMSQLSPIAKISGTSMDDLTAAMEKLSKGVVNSSKETAGAEKALNFLGVSAKDSSGKLKDSATITEEVALKLAGFADGMGKTTIMMDLYGKAGANLVPFMKDLAEFGVKDATITERQAALAKEYEQDLIRLGIAKGALGKIISKEVLPVADAVVKAFLEMTTKAGGVRDATKQLADDGSIRDFAMAAVRGIGLVMNAGDSVTRIFQIVGDSVAELVARSSNAFISLARGLYNANIGQWGAAWDDLKQGIVRDGAIVADAGAKMRATLEKPLAGDAFVATVQANLDKIDSGLNKTAESGKKAADGYKAIGDAQKMAASDNLIAGLEKELVKINELTGMSNKYAQVQIDIAKLKKEGKPVDEERALQLAKEIDDTINLRVELQALYKIEDELDTLRQAKIDHARKIIEGLADENEKTALENSLIGQTAIQQRLANIELERRIALRGVDNQLAIDSINKAYDTKAALASAGQAINDQVSLWSQATAKAGEYFSGLLFRSKSTWEQMKTDAKKFFEDLVALFAQKIFLQIVAGVTGSAAIGNAAASAGANTIGGALLNGAAGTGLFGGSALGLGSVIGDFSAGLAGSGAGVFAAGTSGAMGSAIAGVIGAIPVWGQIALAIGAIAIAIGALKPGGGPKDGGSFYGNYDANGNFLGQARVPGTDNGRFYTPSGQDSQVAAIGQATAASYYSTARALGIRAGAFTGGVGFDTDPRGTADNRTSASAMLNGQSIYSNINQSIGRDSSAIGPAMQLEASRMLLAALKASDLPDYLAHVFDGLTPSSATQAQIDTALQQAAALHTIFDVVNRNPLADAADAMTAAMNPLQTAIRTNQAAINAAMSSYDRSAASTQNLATATTSYYNAQLQLITGIQQAKAAIDDMFGSTMRNIQLAGLDKQGKYNFYQQDAQAQLGLALASNDPETIRRISGIINSDISSAFALLSPEEQAAQSPAFLARAGATQTAIDSHLDDVARTTASQTTETLKRIEEIMRASADQQTAAATTQQTAANTQLTAANTPQHLSIRLDLANGTATVVNGG